MTEPRTAEELANRLGLEDVDVDLLRQALKHPSFVREAGDPPSVSNQRLEFLGDTVLDLVLADRLWGEDEELAEGQLTKLKSSLVREGALARVGRRMGLGEFLLLGRGEEDSGGRDKPSIIADTVEAVIAAVYVSGGLERARGLVLDHFEEEVSAALEAGPADDAKTRLQELLQGYTKELPTYRSAVAGGPPHDPRFRSECRFRSEVIGEGTGRSKRQAEKMAAAAALDNPDLLTSLQANASP